MLKSTSSTSPSNPEHLKLLRDMLRIRRFEEKCAELYTQGKIQGFLHLYIGEEAVAVGAMQALADDDNIVSTYREHGHALARGLSAGAANCPPKSTQRRACWIVKMSPLCT